MRRQSKRGAASEQQSSAIGQVKSIDQLGRELHEAREQQAATTDVLRIVSASTGEVKPVFEATLNKAVRICDAGFIPIMCCGRRTAIVAGNQLGQCQKVAGSINSAHPALC